MQIVRKCTPDVANGGEKISHPPYGPQHLTLGNVVLGQQIFARHLDGPESIEWLTRFNLVPGPHYGYGEPFVGTVVEEPADSTQPVTLDIHLPEGCEGPIQRIEVPLSPELVTVTFPPSEDSAGGDVYVASYFCFQSPRPYAESAGGQAA